ncbi:MAG TPA: hypothetical protein VHF92_13005, partial [Geodermatophilus sp.]|nr:hypothetical protein [Geodermatophilus sp.]
MPSSPPSGPAGFSRRALLGAAAGAVLLAAGCTGEPAGKAPEVTREEADRLAGQVTVQESLVAAYEAATTADPALAGELTPLAAQAGAQLERLRAAAPAAAGSPSGTAAPD